jgi:hypothetical protein
MVSLKKKLNHVVVNFFYGVYEQIIGVGIKFMNKLETIDSESWLLLISDTDNERWRNHKHVNCTYSGHKNGRESNIDLGR